MTAAAAIERTKKVMSRFWHRRDGAIAIPFAVIMPVVVLMIAGAVDLSSVVSDRAALQDAADAAALSGAKQLGSADAVGIKARSKQMITEAVADQASRTTMSITVSIPDTADRVDVNVTAKRTSFFFNMLPVGGWDLNVKASGIQMSKTPLCVLNTGTIPDDLIRIKDSAKITAGQCLVHSDSDLNVGPRANLTAGRIQAVGDVNGTTTPVAQALAPMIEDPFASLVIKDSSRCLTTDVVYENEVAFIQAGKHCGDITAAVNSVIWLKPGVHYFKEGEFTLRNNAVLRGTDVTLIFSSDSSLKANGDATMFLKASRTGTWAGFLMVTTRNNREDFELSSNNARELLGTLYMPQSRLLVRGNKPVADQSAWTVIVAKSIEVTGTSNLVMNANYAASNVPVPKGVGNNIGEASIRLAPN